MSFILSFPHTKPISVRMSEDSDLFNLGGTRGLYLLTWL